METTSQQDVAMAATSQKDFRFATDHQLLHRHRPCLRYDAQEACRAASAAMMTDHRSNFLRRSDGAVIAEAGGAGNALSLGLLARYPAGHSPAICDRLVQGKEPLADGARMQERSRYCNRVYGRVVRERLRTWLQYWLWYYHDHKQLLGLGAHEGDWEMVQVGLDSDGEPEVVTYARHETAVARRWHEVERHRSRAGEHPIVYVAPFSHASYFEPGRHLYLGGIDNPDGKGPSVLPWVERFGSWSAWPGRWGASKGILSRWTHGCLGGRSPASPACQGDKWAAPAKFHRKARRRKPVQFVGRFLSFLGRAVHPREPRIGVRLEGRRALVEFSGTTARLRRPRYVYVTVHAADDRCRLLAARAVRVTKRKGTVPVALPHTPRGCIVRVTAFNFLRQRSGLVEKRAVQRLPGECSVVGWKQPSAARTRRDSCRSMASRVEGRREHRSRDGPVSERARSRNGPCRTGSERGAVASIAILGVPDESAPVVRNNLFIKEAKVVLRANFFNEPTADGQFGYKLVLPTGPVQGVEIGIAEVNVSIPGLTLSKKERKCVQRRGGSCVKRKAKTRKLHWFTVPKCPASGKLGFQAVFGYAGLPVTTRAISLPCARFKR